MSRPPTTVEYVNRSLGGALIFSGELVVPRVNAGNGALKAGVQQPVRVPVAVATGIPVAGVPVLEPFTAITEGEAVVQIAPGVVDLTVGQRLYPSITNPGKATNVPTFPGLFPFGTVLSLQNVAGTAIASVGQVMAPGILFLNGWGFFAGTDTATLMPSTFNNFEGLPGYPMPPCRLMRIYYSIRKTSGPNGEMGITAQLRNTTTTLVNHSVAVQLGLGTDTQVGFFDLPDTFVFPAPGTAVRMLGIIAGYDNNLDASISVTAIAAITGF